MGVSHKGSQSIKRSYGKIRRLPEGRGITTGAWATWAALCTFAKWECEKGFPVRGTCHPSLDTIARTAFLTVRGARLALRQLEAAGYVVTERRYRVKGLPAANEYMLYPDGDAPGRRDAGEERPLTEEEHREIIKKLRGFGIIIGQSGERQESPDDDPSRL